MASILEFRNLTLKYASKKSKYLKKSPEMAEIVLNSWKHEIDPIDSKEFDFIRL